MSPTAASIATPGAAVANPGAAVANPGAGVAKPDRGYVAVNPELCKGCGLCVEACVPRVLALAPHLNRFGYHPVQYLGHGCSGCGLCFHACPEPGGLVVYKRPAAPATAAKPAGSPVAA